MTWTHPVSAPRGLVVRLAALLSSLVGAPLLAQSPSGDAGHALPARAAFAPTPPMGWNSWDAFGTTLTESQAKAQADAMAAQLKPAGWTVFTVDIQWYEPNSKAHSYTEGAILEMDAYSRLVPAVKKFPSAANGAGFKPLADYVHARGLKFGIHLMRGIPRQAVQANTAVLGTTARARDIALTSSTCSWNPDMYGVDLRKPGAQEYYDSLFALYASWGVDFVKVDDISRPYDAVQQAEIEAIRRAIDKTGRAIVLSLSPGDTPLARGEHVSHHANLWRISDDFWDRWTPLYEMFDRLHRWTPHRRAGAWPDADMLPFGTIELGRATRFTQDEQRLCMTLWSIARSPLIFGGDVTKLDDFTRGLLTNPEVLAVNQTSTGNRQLSRDEDLIVWTAEVPNSPDRYVALFNAQGSEFPYNLAEAKFKSAVLSGAPGEQVVDIEVPIANARKLVLVLGDGGDGWGYDHGAWIEPTLSGPQGRKPLTKFPWVSATAGWNQPRVGRTVDDQPLVLQGASVDGIGTHAVSAIEYDLPAGYETFSARAMITPGSNARGSVQFMVLVDPTIKVAPPTNRVSVALAALGLSGAVKVRDLWRREDLGTATDSWSAEIPRHGARLYRFSPVTTK